jgi:hypothetical protein
VVRLADGFSEHAHASPAQRFLGEARSAGTAPVLPDEFEELISGPSFVGVCQGCRTITHVISHGTGGSTRKDPARPA